MNSLILHDIQNDFFQYGTMNVPKESNFIEKMNSLLRLTGKKFDISVLTQDYHTPQHHVFASNNPGKKLDEKIELHNKRQFLWPDHCVQNTPGASFHPGLEIQFARFIVKKGMNPMFDTSSAFFDKGKVNKTQLHEYLQFKKVNEVVIAGLALDLGITQTALDAKELGYGVSVIVDLCPAYKLSKEKNKERWNLLLSEGIKMLNSADFIK